jgi:hypothetical protein
MEACAKKRRIIKENEVTEKNKKDKEIDIHQSELCTQSIKQSEEFSEQDIRETYKKDCNWIKFSSGDYSLNTQFIRNSFKKDRAYKKAFDRLKNYISDELNVCDSSQECKVSPR